MNVIVTGSTGFVGGALVPKLSENHRVLCPTRSESNLIAGPIDLDLCVKENEVDLVIHLAHPRVYNLLSAMSEAILMIKNVLEVCRLNDLSLLYLSSLVIFSGHHDAQKITSKLRPLPESTYGQAKLLCEQLIETYRKLYGLRTVLLRPSYLYGPGMDTTRALYKFVRKAAAQEPMTVHRYTNGFQVFDFLYIDDLVDAIMSSLESMPLDPVNVGTGTGTSMMELAQMIRVLTNSRSEIRIIDINSQTSKLVVDPTEPAAALTWKPKIDLRGGLQILASTVGK
jgi:nucleoside-diphosphate-sugar epimerase